MESYSRRFKSRKIRSKRRTDGASAFNTRTARGRILLIYLARGEDKLRESFGSTTAWWWSLQFSGRASPSTTTKEEVLGRERAAPGEGVRLPCASPLYIGVEGAGFLPSKSIGALAKVGGKKSHPFSSPLIVIPLFRDLDLIPSGYDLIPSKVGSWCALTRGVGPCPHYPRSCGSLKEICPRGNNKVIIYFLIS